MSRPPVPRVKSGVTRLIFTALSIVLQITAIVVIFMRLNEYAEWIAIGTNLLAFILILVIYAQDKTSALKMPWIILILVFPIFGLTLYLLLGMSGSSRKMRKRFEAQDARLMPLIRQDPSIVRALEERDSSVAGVARYLGACAHYPVYRNTDVEYFADATEGLEAQIEELRRAEKFIFMEYHAIEDTGSFHRVRDILAQKAAEGVEVRLFYDDMGSIGFINTDFVKRMEALGISCRVFNPFKIMLNVFLNNRDHRKITVIDGRVGFTGGYNIADEYFNITHPYGMWKDTGIKLTGDAVRSLTITFLEMWNAVNEDDATDADIARFLPEVRYEAREQGFVLPYADSPMDDEAVGENVYLSLIEQAQDYCYLCTPYLIITDEMNHALRLARKRGVDVRLITPGIPDKKPVYKVTRSYYHSLARDGVRIYEWTPGFCHAKQCASDDRVALCGTINLDYRSFYHHFENACLFAYCDAVTAMKADFEATFAQCEEVTEKYASAQSAPLRLSQLIMRLFAPLL